MSLNGLFAEITISVYEPEERRLRYLIQSEQAKINAKYNRLNEIRNYIYRLEAKKNEYVSQGRLDMVRAVADVERRYRQTEYMLLQEIEQERQRLEKLKSQLYDVTKILDEARMELARRRMLRM